MSVVFGDVFLDGVENVFGDVFGVDDTTPDVPNLGLHINGDHFHVDGTTTLAAHSSLDPIDIDADWHAHGTADLTVTDTAISNESNCSVTFISFPMLPMTVNAGTVQDFTLQVTPLDFGPFSFYIIIESDDADQPVLTVTVEGEAIESGAAVFPDPSVVLLGTVYGPNGDDFVGTLRRGGVLPTQVAYSPAYIIAQYLLDNGLVSSPTGSASDIWPVYVSAQPTAPINVVTSFDTSGIIDGQMMSGATVEHRGVSVRVRGNTYNTAYGKALAIHEKLKTVRRDTVDLSGASFRLNHVSLQGSVLSIGQEPDSRKDVFVINLRASITTLVLP